MNTGGARSHMMSRVSRPFRSTWQICTQGVKNKVVGTTGGGNKNKKKKRETQGSRHQQERDLQARCLHARQPWPPTGVVSALTCSMCSISMANGTGTASDAHGGCASALGSALCPSPGVAADRAPGPLPPPPPPPLCLHCPQVCASGAVADAPLCPLPHGCVNACPARGPCPVWAQVHGCTCRCHHGHGRVAEAVAPAWVTHLA